MFIADCDREEQTGPQHDRIVLDRLSFFFVDCRGFIKDDTDDSNDRWEVIKLFGTDSRPGVKTSRLPDNVAQTVKN